MLLGFVVISTARTGSYGRVKFCLTASVLFKRPAVHRANSSQGVGPIVQVIVRDNNVDQALRALKKKLQREGVFREMKLRRNFEKPSEKRAREKAEAVRRHRKLLRKRMEREGY